MKLRTLVPVSYNKRGTVREQATGLVEMTLGSVAYSNDFKNLGVNYTYKTVEVAATEETPAVPSEEITTNAFHMEEEQINGVFALIQPNLPIFENEVQMTRAKFLEGAKYQMAATFGITVAEIEIVE